MPVEVLCGGCGHRLHIGVDVRTPRDLLRNIGHSCRHCGARLSTRDFQIDVMVQHGPTMTTLPGLAEQLEVIRAEARAARRVESRFKES